MGLSDSVVQIAYWDSGPKLRQEEEKWVGRNTHVLYILLYKSVYKNRRSERVPFLGSELSTLLGGSLMECAGQVKDMAARGG